MPPRNGTPLPARYHPNSCQSFVRVMPYNNDRKVSLKGGFPPIGKSLIGR
jgi:hypothetical protein